MLVKGATGVKSLFCHSLISYPKNYILRIFKWVGNNPFLLKALRITSLTFVVVAWLPKWWWHNPNEGINVAHGSNTGTEWSIGFHVVFGSQRYIYNPKQRIWGRSNIISHMLPSWTTYFQLYGERCIKYIPGSLYLALNTIFSIQYYYI